MKRWTGFLFLYAALGVVTWFVIGSESEMQSKPLEAAAAALPLAPKSTTAPSSVPPLLPESPWVSKVGSNLDEEFECLALNVYWEARSESSLGQFAVAAVTLNRVESPRFPNSICGVVRHGGSERLNRCQFSWWCDGKRDTPEERNAWLAAQSIAYTALFLNPPDPTKGALWYHANYVRPNWANVFSPTKRIGRHIYYRQSPSTKRAGNGQRS